ncbi:2-dehydropantoate 2-reductase N-terminal domain-containing protein, partial [Streptococcus sp. DD11]|uniref:2-dehydropantoate 2-reductase N-terminal domain-containing protein n=1 Tax=Streptococcus sp. DD11 TaxID=1777879 RepID=UPI0010085D47
LLSQQHQVTVLVREHKLSAFEHGFNLSIKDLRKNDRLYKAHHFQPALVTSIAQDYDLILLAVNSSQLEQALQQLAAAKGKAHLLILQNNWAIKSKIPSDLDRKQVTLAFPSSVGGGRRSNGQVRAIIFKAPTLLDDDAYQSELAPIFTASGIGINVMPDLASWMKVHCLQEAVMAGAVAEAGTFEALLKDKKAIRKMIGAWREGLELCQRYGIPKARYKPTKYLSLPLFLLVPAVKSMLSQPLIAEMVTNHMQSGYAEWADQYFEIKRSAEKAGIKMTHWNSYSGFIDQFLKKNP